MSNAAPFRIEVLDRTYRRVAFVGAPNAVNLAPRHMAMTTCELEVGNDSPATSHLLAEGARLRVTYAGETWTGPVRRLSGSGPTVAGTFTFGMDDDLRLLTRLLAFPKPTFPLSEQRTYDTRTGPAETVVKALIRDNADRLNLPLTIEADQGRGATITVKARMVPAADVLLAQVDAAGIGLRVVQTGAGFRLSAYEPRDYDRTLTEASRVVGAWEVNREAPAWTRVVVGGAILEKNLKAVSGVSYAALGRPDEHRRQEFFTFVSDARETAWNDLIEQYVDASDISSDYEQAIGDTNAAYRDYKDAESDEAAAARTALITAVAAEAAARDDYLELIDQRGRDSLAEGAARTGVRVTLSETTHFRYGATGLRVGDRVRIETGPGLVIDEVLREASVSWTSDAGLLVTPVVGEITDSPVRSLVRGVSQIGAAVRALRARR